jgi:hypothetical protein
MRKVLGFLIAATLAYCLTTGVAFARGGGGGHGGGGHGYGGHGYGAYYGYANGYYYPQSYSYPYYPYYPLRAWSYYGNP